MPTGQAAQQQAPQTAEPAPPKDEDRGPGSVAGNLTKDPELRYTNAGTAVCNLRLACSERVRNAATGDWEDGPPSYYDIQCWARLAENVCNTLERGDRIVAEGRWMAHHWEDDQQVIQERLYLRARDLGPSIAYWCARLERKRDQ